MVTWECDFNQRLAEEEDYAREIRELRQSKPYLREPFELREALLGGRTEAFTLLKSIDPSRGQRIRYLDVTSLYPSRMMFCEYPLGHPTVLTNVPVKDLRKYKGLAHVTVVPTQGGFIPFLPSRVQTNSGFKKLVYTNCSKCAEECNFQFDSCQHSEWERAITGIYTTHELFPALDAGYKVLKVYELWHYTNWTTDAYSRYVKTWLKVKQQASGYPSWADTDEKKARYVKDYFEKEGVKLDPDEIEYCAVKRAFAKLMLNSSWGFLGRNLENDNKELVRTPDRFFKLMCDSTTTDKQCRWLDEEHLIFTSKPLKSFIRPDGKGSLVHAIYTTSHARVMLTSALVKLGRRALYCDTDSIIFFKNKPEYEPGDIETGDYLGDWTSEEPEAIITEFVAGGAKNYGYMVRMPDGTEKAKFKVRGITLNNATKEVINFQTLKDLVLESKLNDLMGDYGDSDENGVPLREIEVPTHNFKRIFTGSDAFTIRPEETVKTYKLVFDKRVLDPSTLVSFPFGHV